MACEAARNRTSRRDRTAAVITLFQEEGSWEEDAEDTELVAPLKGGEKRNTAQKAAAAAAVELERPTGDKATRDAEELKREARAARVF